MSIYSIIVLLIQIIFVIIVNYNKKCFNENFLYMFNGFFLASIMYTITVISSLSYLYEQLEYLKILVSLK